MGMFKRFFLFAAVNILIVVTISIILKLLGVGYYLDANGINYQSLMIFCLVWGMAGSFISLAISKFMAKKFMGVQIVDGDPRYMSIVNIVHLASKAAGMSKMPEVGVYDSPDINAFATGPSKNNSLVALSSGLLQKMDSEEVKGVIGHEVAHIANGDMVTMALLQGVINAFVMFFARVVAFAISQVIRGDDDEGEGLGFFAHIMVVFLFEILFGILGSIVVNFFSRFREYKADAGSAKLVGKDAMLKALHALDRNYETLLKSGNNKQFKSMQISSKKGFLALLSTHPDIKDRIAVLERS